MSTFLTRLNSVIKAASDYRSHRAQWEQIANEWPQLLSVLYVASGTPTSSFAAEWGTYGCPEEAFMIEGTTLWATTDSGTSWFNPGGGTVGLETGMEINFYSDTLPSGFLWCDGSAQLIASYSDLNTVLAALSPVIQRDLVMSAWTSSSDADFTISNGIDGMANGDTVDLYWNSGANSRLGMTVGSSTQTSMNLSGGTGDSIPNSVGMAATFNFAATKFLLPDSRGTMALGNDSMDGLAAGRVTDTEADNVGQQNGEEDHTTTTSEMPAHEHDITFYWNTSQANSLVTGSQYIDWNVNYDTDTSSIQTTGGGSAHNNMPPYTTCNVIIKT